MVWANKETTYSDDLSEPGVYIWTTFHIFAVKKGVWVIPSTSIADKQSMPQSSYDGIMQDQIRVDDERYKAIVDQMMKRDGL